MDTEALTSLSKDLRAAASTMTRDEARYLVDSYYQMQDNRLRASGQIRAQHDEPHRVLTWLEENASSLEKQIAAALGAYAKSQPMGQWAMNVVGIGPVIAAGLLAHIDIAKVETAGDIWSFAGYNPDMVWDKGQKRPFNAKLKVVCWKAWQSWLKLKNNDDCYYAKVLFTRRDYEWKRNLAGGNGEACAKALQRNIGKTTNARAWYEGRVSPKWAREVLDSCKPFPQTLPACPDGEGVPMLPPAQILSRSGRYAVKLFLAHWFEVAYRKHHGKEPPLPYPIAHLGHAHRILPVDKS